MEYIQETKTNIDLEKKGSSANISETTTTSIDSNPIQEATTWKINDRGNVELVAQSPNVARINSDCPVSYR